MMDVDDTRLLEAVVSAGGRSASCKGGPKRAFPRNLGKAGAWATGWVCSPRHHFPMGVAFLLVLCVCLALHPGRLVHVSTAGQRCTADPGSVKQPSFNGRRLQAFHSGEKVAEFEGCPGDLFNKGLPEDQWASLNDAMVRRKEARLAAIAGNSSAPNTLHTCATAEEMGASMTADVRCPSLGVRSRIETFLDLHAADKIAKLEPREFCQHKFVFGHSNHLKNGLGNGFYEGGIGPLILGMILNRTVIWGEERSSQPDYKGELETADGTYGGRSAEAFIEFNARLFSMDRLKQLWATNGCASKFGRPLVVRQLRNMAGDVHAHTAQVSFMCDDLTKWDVPLIQVTDLGDMGNLALITRSRHPHIRRKAAELFGEPMLPHTRPNLLGEALRALISPRPVIARAVSRVLKDGAPVVSVHMRMMQLDCPDTVAQATVCTRNALQQAGQTDGTTTLPTVLLVTDTPSAGLKFARSLQGIAKVIRFNATLYKIHHPEEERLPIQEDHLASDWGKDPRWAAVVDFFLAAETSHAFISVSPTRVATTFGHLAAAFAASKSYGLGEPTPVNATFVTTGHDERGGLLGHVGTTAGRGASPAGAFKFYCSFSAKHLKNGVPYLDSAGSWSSFTGPLSCKDQPGQCALTSLLPYNFFEHEWASPHAQHRRNSFLEKGIPLTPAGDLPRAAVEEFCNGLAEPQRRWNDVEHVLQDDSVTESHFLTEAPEPSASEPSKEAPGADTDHAERERKKLRELATSVAVNSTVIICTVNKGYYDFYSNWVGSLERLGLASRVIAFTIDQPTFDFVEAHWPGHAILLQSEAQSDKFSDDFAAFGSQSFNDLTVLRAYHMRDLLGMGFSVIYSDIDTVWLRDPHQILTSAYDVSVTDDGSSTEGDMEGSRQLGKDTVGLNVCTCFMHVKPTQVGITFVDTWIEAIHNQTENGRVHGNDQVSLNKVTNSPEILAGRGVAVQLLPRVRFPSGAYGMKEEWFSKNKGKMFWVHANYLAGSEEKRKGLERLDMWHPSTA
ncbi:hypothetical protein KFL_002180100 [Klebsormidium nitens]|uniref:Nucleotide-diphospho-sugar transferase domain-containing protein n=1 Tax=Klebsormidium nitens TaxID=105231 RepID=A0A1Y1I282_KLENI|nr:hypothetical protein KFL_002180100 [Klebsormidium nitens]|eukprot:GAQ85035.1 hypothetical protein KFL_002180100 [Klebsormidium nitens]